MYLYAVLQHTYHTSKHEPSCRINHYHFVYTSSYIYSTLITVHTGRFTTSTLPAVVALAGTYYCSSLCAARLLFGVQIATLLNNTFFVVWLLCAGMMRI